MPRTPYTPISGRAEYATRFNRVVDHIQAHLAEPLDLETLAAVACFSPFHFHRLFHAWMGETIHALINRLRLERAAAQLVYNPGKTITEIALDCGFSSSATFARAFRAFHGRSASAWREERKLCKPESKIGKAEEPAGTSSSGHPPGTDPLRLEAALMLNVAVKDLQPMQVAYLRHVGAFQGNPDLFARQFGKLRQWAGPRGLLALPSARLISVHHDNPEMGITQSGKLRLDVAITVPPDTREDGGISRQRLEGGPYAVTRVRIQPTQYMETWDALMSGWLPASGYQPDDRPCLEIHLNDPTTAPDGAHDVELCLAVKPL